MILRYGRWPAPRLLQRLAGYTALVVCRCTGNRHEPSTCARLDVARIVAELHRRTDGGAPPLVNYFTPSTEKGAQRLKRRAIGHA